MQRHAFRILSSALKRRYPSSLMGCNAVTSSPDHNSLDQPARIMVEPVGRTPNPPHHDLFRNTHDFERKGRELGPNLGMSMNA
jgi:hypothetical protein